MADPFVELVCSVRKRLAADGGISDQQLATLTATEPEALATFSSPAVDETFAVAWPPDLQLDGEALPNFLDLVAQARSRDSTLQRWCDKLVPRRVPEAAFWRNYFYFDIIII